MTGGVSGVGVIGGVEGVGVMVGVDGIGLNGVGVDGVGVTLCESLSLITSWSAVALEETGVGVGVVAAVEEVGIAVCEDCGTVVVVDEAVVVVGGGPYFSLKLLRNGTNFSIGCDSWREDRRRGLWFLDAAAADDDESALPGVILIHAASSSASSSATPTEGKKCCFVKSGALSRLKFGRLYGAAFRRFSSSFSLKDDEVEEEEEEEDMNGAIVDFVI